VDLDIPISEVPIISLPGISTFIHLDQGRIRGLYTLQAASANLTASGGGGGDMADAKNILGRVGRPGLARRHPEDDQKGGDNL
jgi:hypothetical protein